MNSSKAIELRYHSASREMAELLEESLRERLRVGVKNHYSPDKEFYPTDLPVILVEEGQEQRAGLYPEMVSVLITTLRGIKESATDAHLYVALGSRAECDEYHRTVETQSNFLIGTLEEKFIVRVMMNIFSELSTTSPDRRREVCYQVGDVEIVHHKKSDTGEVMANGELLELTRSQYLLMVALAEHFPNLATYDKLTKKIYDSDHDKRHAIKVLVTYVREKLEKAGSNCTIANEFNKGYRLQTHTPA